jgi:hypothetical protein
MFLHIRAIPLVRLSADVLNTNNRYFLQREKRPAEDNSLFCFLNLFLKGICTMKDDDSSISAKQHLDDFERALGEFLKGLLGPSTDTLPPGLPTPVKPNANRPEKGAKSDKSG